MGKVNTGGHRGAPGASVGESKHEAELPIPIPSSLR